MNLQQLISEFLISVKFAYPSFTWKIGVKKRKKALMMSSFAQYVPFYLFIYLFIYFLSSNLLLQDHAKVFNLSMSVSRDIFNTLKVDIYPMYFNIKVGLYAFRFFFFFNPCLLQNDEIYLKKYKKQNKTKQTNVYLYSLLIV